MFDTYWNVKMIVLFLLFLISNITFVSASIEYFNPIDLALFTGNENPPKFKEGAWTWNNIVAQPYDFHQIKIDPSKTTATVAIIKTTFVRDTCFHYYLRRESLVIKLSPTDLVLVCPSIYVTPLHICRAGAYYNRDQLKENTSLLPPNCAIFKHMPYTVAELDSLSTDLFDSDSLKRLDFVTSTVYLQPTEVIEIASLNHTENCDGEQHDY